jgi:hypothetical protein
MEATAMMFLDCPAYTDAHGAARCGLPAEVQDRHLATSTDGPLECAKIRCPRGHWFNGPIEFLTWDKNQSKSPETGGSRCGIPPTGHPASLNQAITSEGRATKNTAEDR